MRFNKLLMVFFLFIIGCTGRTKEDEIKALPNIIYILADDLGYGDISSFNENGKIKTPGIDKIASEGMIFTDAHTSSAVCTPTRYGILTGRYNWRSRLKSSVLTGKSKALIPPDRTTVASILQKHGYHTAFIGKWHLGWDWALKDEDNFGGDGWSYTDFQNIDFAQPVTNIPNDLGFDYAYGHSGSLDMAPYVYVENGRVTEIPDSVTVSNSEYGWWRKGPTSKDFNHDDVTPNFFRRSVQYIKDQSVEDHPFFLYLALPSPHTPILPAKEWQGKSGLNPYADFVMMIDFYINYLVKEVENSGLSDNTMIIFTSDNGCSPAANIDTLQALGHYPSFIYRGHKADIYEGGHRVPFIIKWPNMIKPGSVSEDVICTTDLMATCAEIVGYVLNEDEGEDSYSLLPLLKGDTLAKPLREATVHHSINGSFAIRQGDWKLIMCPGSGGWSFPKPGNKAVLDTLPPYQLYNLKNDPGETKNLYLVNQEKFTELKSLLTQYIVEGRSTPGIKQSNDSIHFEWKQTEFID